MKLILIFVLLISTTSWAADSKKWKLPSDSVQSISIKGVSGRVSFKQSDVKNISISIRVHKAQGEDVALNLDSLKPQVKDKKLSIVINPDLSQRQWVEKAQNSTFVKIDLMIVGPSMPVDLFWRQGAISFSEWKHSIDLNSLGSDISLSKIEADIKVHNQKGKITIVQSKGSVEVEGYDNIIKLSQHEGRVVIDNYMGQTNVTSIKGDVEIDQNKGQLMAKNIKGSFNFNNHLASVEFSKVDGAVRGKGQLGDVLGRVNGEADIRIKTERGRVQLKTAASAASVNLGTSEGSIQAPRYLKMTRYASFQHTTGRLRGQHKGNIYVRTKSGSINLR